MRAAYITETGPAEAIQVGELPDSQPSGSEVLVRVKAASVNPIDTYLRSGAVPMELPMPYIVGSDLAGVVEDVGPEATMFAPGDRVWGANQGVLGRQGTFCELAAIDEQWLYPTPEGVSDELAAASALVGITVSLGLVDEADLQPGETILVHGASGAVGSAVLQMAKAMGARVIAATGSAEKVEYCKSLGADEVIEYRHENLHDHIEQAAPDGVDVWWETCREPDLQLAVGSLAMRGRLVLMAGRDAQPHFPLGPFYTKCCKALGFVMFLAEPDAQRRAAERVSKLLADGKLTTRIARAEPLEKAAELHVLQQEHTIRGHGGVLGKLVATM